MVDISDISGITKTDHVYEVTSNVLLAATYDDVVNAVIVIRSGGQLRFGNNADVTFEHCLILEEPDAGNPGADNWNSTNCRYQSGCDVTYRDCSYIIANSTGSGNSNRRDFDVRPGANVTFRDTRIVIEVSSTDDTYNHFNSSGIDIDGLVMDNADAGGPFETNTEFTQAASRLEIVDPRTSSAAARQFVFLANNVTDADVSLDRLTIRRSNGQQWDNLAVIAMWNGNQTDLLTLSNPLGDVQKDTSNNASLRGNMLVSRTYKGSIVDGETAGLPDLDCTIRVMRTGSQGSESSETTGWNGTVTIHTGAARDYVVLQGITGVSNPHDVLTVGDPIVFGGTNVPPQLTAGTTYYLGGGSGLPAGGFRLYTTRDRALSGSRTGTQITGIAGPGAAGCTFTVDLFTADEDDGAYAPASDDNEWDVQLAQYLSMSHNSASRYRDVYRRVISRYGHLPSHKALQVAWAAGRETGIDDGTIIMRADPAITETTEATVAAYTGFAIDLDTETVTISEDHTYGELADWLQYQAVQNLTHSFVIGEDFMLATRNARTLEVSLNITVSSNATVTAGDAYDSLVTTQDVDVTNGTIDASYEDQSGVRCVVTTSPARSDAIAIAKWSGQTGDPLEISADSAGKLAFTAPADTTVTVVAKAPTYRYNKFTMDTGTMPAVTASLVRESFVDAGEDISAYTEDSTATAPATDNVWFNYVEAKSQLVFGELNTSGDPELTKRLLDDRITSFDGLRWIENYDDTITDLDGRPYEILSDRMNIDEDDLEFVRTSGMTVSQKSLCGLAVFEKDKTTKYVAPVSNNDDVRFDSLATINILDTNTAEDVVERVRANEDYQDDLAARTSEKIRQDMQEDDYFNSISMLSTHANGTGSTDAEVAKMYDVDVTSGLTPTAAANSDDWQYVTVKLGSPVSGRDRPELVFDVGGTVLSGTTTKVGTRMEIKVYAFESSSDLPSNVQTYVSNANNIPVVSTTGTAKTDVVADISNRTTGYVMFAFRSTQSGDNFVMSISDFKIRASPARLIHDHVMHTMQTAKEARDEAKDGRTHVKNSRRYNSTTSKETVEADDGTTASTYSITDEDGNPSGATGNAVNRVRD